MHTATPHFQAVLVVSFGGPNGPADIRPFLANVLRGRRIPPARVEEVAHHYELFGGVSPLTAITNRQAEGLRHRLAAAGQPLPVYVGMRNWHPYLADTLREMHAAGIRRAVGFIAAAQHVGQKGADVVEAPGAAEGDEEDGVKHGPAHHAEAGGAKGRWR